MEFHSSADGRHGRKNVPLANVAAIYSSIKLRLPENAENVMAQHATMLHEIKLWHMLYLRFKKTYVICISAHNSSCLKNEGKGLQFCFQISVNVLHVDDISVIYITPPG